MEIHKAEKDGRTVLALKGRFDFQSHQQFRKVVDDLTGTGKADLLIDLADVDFIDSSALGLLLRAREQCLQGGGNLLLAHPQEYVHRVLKLCRFDELFQVDS